MKTISSVVKSLLFSYPFIEEGFKKDLINYSSLARELVPIIEEKLGKKVQVGAVVMAIKRLEPSFKNKENNRLEEIISEISDITVRSELVDITYLNSKTIVKKQLRLLEKIQERSDLFYTFNQGVTETTMIASKSLGNIIETLFESEIKIGEEKNLASLTIKLPENNEKISGVYYFLFRKIAWEGINILDVISTTNEFSLIVHEKDIDILFSILKKMKKN